MLVFNLTRTGTGLIGGSIGTVHGLQYSSEDNLWKLKLVQV